jgi:hypothetical protein
MGFRGSSRLPKTAARDDERATRLQQSLPFLDVLSPSERQALIRDAGSGE